MRTAVNRYFQFALSLLVLALVLPGCGSTRGNEPGVLYDFGPIQASDSAAAQPAIPVLVVADVTGSAALDTQSMFYRLNYADPLQARAYANNRWNGTPLQLLSQRFKTLFAASGIKVLSVSDAGATLPLIRIEVDEFSQNFDTPAQNHGLLVLRASVFIGHKLINQQTFSAKVASTSADAAGGTRALASATDKVAQDMIKWLGSLPRN
jgi:cholesterol transport system auxiliary component